MALSKSLYSIMGAYFEQLYNHPVRTKSILSCVLATVANYTSQRLDGHNKIIHRHVLAYALFGLIFGGSIPHYFYETIERLIHHNVKFRYFLILLCERLIYTPIYHILFLYTVSRFECNSHAIALKNLKTLYWPLLKYNWQHLTTFHLLNLYVVPQMFRPVTTSVASFVWIMYVSHKYRKQLNKDNKNGKILPPSDDSEVESI